MEQIDDQENIRRIHFLESVEKLKNIYMDDGLSEFNAKMKAIMSDESLSILFPDGYDEDFISQLREVKEESNGTVRNGSQ
jgi:hypothetical protein